MTKIEARSRALAILVALALVLSMVAPASAQQRRGYGATRPEPETRSGLSMVSEVDVGAGTLVVDEVTYRTDDRTSIHRHTGQPATLASIRVPRRAPGRLVPSHEVDYIRFEAEEVGGRWVMRSITILEEPSR